MNESPSPATRFTRIPGVFRLETGGILREPRIAFRTWGDPDDEAILVCHALTGNADADEWWVGLFGSGQPLDPANNYIISSNVLGSCYGTTGPTDIRPKRFEPWGSRFPTVTIRDMVDAQSRLLDELGVERLKLVVGGSMGAMQALEWGAMYPDRVQAIVAIGAGAAQSAWSIALSDAQRAAIESDPSFLGGRYEPGRGPKDGLATARMIAMVSYRGPDSFESRFGRGKSEGQYEINSYLRYQGRKLVERFDANSYLTLVSAMDSHDLSRGRGGWDEAFGGITSPTLVIGISSDVLYPETEVKRLAISLPNARYERLSASHGHDAFLIETETLGRMINRFTADLAAGQPAQVQSFGNGAAWA